ncbi:tyrosine-type recombinase/integrase [Ornithinimicrobium sp. Y1694]|uniref:tyrosine-type recombinase/integrase n=1 Tax=Ornithinimicrobium sp. Y1694 TaxID=3418590 RepID=UPI003CF2D6F5
MARTKRSFGEIDKRASGRFRARYTGPDGQRHSAPHTFDTKADAETWLTLRRSEIIREDWTPASTSRMTFGVYAETWLSDRPLKPTTRQHYRSLLDNQILPTFDTVPMKAISPAMVRKWHTSLPADRPTLRAHAYGLLRAVLQTALHDGEITSNPVHIRGAGNAKRVKKIEPASLAELEALVAAMPERYTVMTLLAAWCGLRFGELTELRRKDVDVKAGVIKVRRAVTRVEGEYVVGTPKSDAGIRDVAIPPHLLAAVKSHLADNITGGRDGLLFPAAGDPAKHLAPASLYKVFYRAREAAGRPDLRWHDLRHTGAVLAAQTGATLAELMGRLGHSTPQAALRYQHVAGGRDAQIAAALSALAEGGAK